LNAKKKAMGGRWERAVRVQPGAPLCPRVARLVDRVTTELGFSLWDGRTPRERLPSRTLIETFPAEAIWALGVSGFFGPEAPDSIRLYKLLSGRHVTRRDAMEWAARPLRGFARLLEPKIDLSPAIEDIVDWACADAKQDGGLLLTKRYDDMVDSAIAWLTALAFARDEFHVLVAPDSDGHIVGPGRLPASTT
jgi:hypothetical protein